MSEFNLESEFKSPAAILDLSPEELADRLLPLARHIAADGVFRPYDLLQVAKGTGLERMAIAAFGGEQYGELCVAVDHAVHCLLRQGRVLPAYTAKGGGNALRILD